MFSLRSHRLFKPFGLILFTQLLCSNLLLLVKAAEDVDLLVVYKNRRGREKIDALLDFFLVNRTRILDVIYEIVENTTEGTDFDKFSPAELISSIKTPNDLWERFRDQLNNDNNIASVTMNPPRKIPPNDVFEEKIVDVVDTIDVRGRELRNILPPGIETVQANELWDYPFKERIGVCVVDTGYDLGHIDLPIEGVTGSTPQRSYGLWSVDENSHGTHCAGTIGALVQNNLGVDSCMRKENFRFHIGKGLNKEGSGSGSTIMASVRGCQSAGAKVISMSLGGSANNPDEAAFYRSKFDEGLLIIAAAGNDGNTAKSYPASYGSVMSVAAYEDGADFSQQNNQVEISAPGVDVRSTYPGDRISSKTGTSMATPHVAGVAALIWSRFPECTNVQIRNILVMTAKKLGGVEYSNRYGYGLVQAKEAFDLLNSSGCEAADSFDNPLLYPTDETRETSEGNIVMLIIIIVAVVVGLLLLAAVGYKFFYAKSATTEESYE